MARSARFSALFGRDLHLLAFTLRLLALALLGLLGLPEDVRRVPSCVQSKVLST